MNGISVAIITRSDELPPQASAGPFFHGAALFRALEADPRQRPYMAVASGGGRVVAHMLVALRRRGSLLPPCLFAQGRIYGEGCYAPGCDREELFGLMLLFALSPYPFVYVTDHLGIGRAGVPELALSGGAIGQVLAAPPVEEFALQEGVLRKLIGAVGTMIFAA